MSETLIGKGRTAKVYKFCANPNLFVRKQFSPSYPAKLWNNLFYKSPHPLSVETGWSHAYWKRRLAHRLAEYFNEGSSIIDALDSYEGFVSKFIEGHEPSSHEEKKVAYDHSKKLEEFFDDIGMPTWSFSSRNPFSDSNFIINDSGINIIDYEQSVPMPDVRGNVCYDTIYFDDVSKFVGDNKANILDKLGRGELSKLEKALEMSKESFQKLDIRPRVLTKFGERISKPLSKKELLKLIENLYEEEKINYKDYKDFIDGKTGELTKLAMMNFGVHASIGLATPSGIASGISSVLRPLWTISNFIRYTIKGDYEKRRIHNFRVALVSAIPFIGNGAYFLPIMEENSYVGLAINDSFCRALTGKSLEESMKKMGAVKLFKPLLTSYKWFSELKHISRVEEKILGSNTKKAHDILLSYLMSGVKNDNQREDMA